MRAIDQLRRSTRTLLTIVNFQVNGRRTVKFFISPTRSAARLIRLQWSRSINVLSSRRYHVQRIRTSLSSYYQCRSLRLIILRATRSLVLFFKLRATIRRASLMHSFMVNHRNLVRVFHVLSVRQFKFLSREHSSMHLLSVVRLFSGRLGCVFSLIQFIPSHFSQFSTIERLIGR